VAELVDVAGDMVGLHATDPASVYLAVAARCPGADAGALTAALYDDRALVRVLGMRRTMFVLPAGLVPVVHSACTRAIAARERRHLVKQLEEGGVAADGGAWLGRVEAATVAALAARGEATAAELSSDVPELRRQLSFGEGRKWAGRQGVSTRVLFVLAADGRVVRGRPLGSWTSTQYRWAPTASWLPGGVAELPTSDAQAELARRWLASFGPAAAADLQWWTGWPATATKAALARHDLAEVDLGGVTGLVLADDQGSVAAPEPWAALLPALDPTVMGWAGREWFLGRHGPALFDRTGNAGPTVWWDGRVVGGWAQRSGGEIVFRLLDDVGAEAVAAVEAAAGRLAAWLGPVRVVPRFHTPLERELG